MHPGHFKIGRSGGLAFINKFIPATEVYAGDTLKYHARHITHRMVKHLRDNGWKIVDPDGGQQ